MIRFCFLVLASMGLWLVKPESLFDSNLAQNQFATLHWYLKWASLSWAVLEFNSVLNRWAENRWVWKNAKSGWNWRSEVAVVTGGSAGIGACVAKRLASYGIKVAVLDIGPLSESFTKGT